jgi:hypothetical protein
MRLYGFSGQGRVSWRLRLAFEAACRATNYYFWPSEKPLVQTIAPLIWLCGRADSHENLFYAIFAVIIFISSQS